MADDQDTQAPEDHPREDNRNELAGSPIPDPTNKDTDTEDVPDAD
jgi:hypothetical protein